MNGSLPVYADDTLLHISDIEFSCKLTTGAQEHYMQINITVKSGQNPKNPASGVFTYAPYFVIHEAASV